MKENKDYKKLKNNKITFGLSSIFNLRYLKRLLNLFKVEYKSFGWYILLLGILSFFGGILEGVGVTAIIPVFSLLDKGKTETADFISQFIEKFFSFFHLPYTLKFLFIFILVLFIFKSIILFISGYISAYVATSYEKKTKCELFNLTLKSDWNSLSQQKIGHLNQILNVDVSFSSSLLTYISMCLISIANLAVYSLLAFNVSPIVTLITVVFGAIIFFIFKPLLYKNKILSQEVVKLSKELAHYVDEVIISMKTLKSMFLEEPVVNIGYKQFDRFKVLSMRMYIFKNLTAALLPPLGIGLIIVIFIFFYKILALNFASFAVVIYAINKIFTNIQIFQNQLHRVSTCEPYLTDIISYKENVRKYEEKDDGDMNFSFSDKLELKSVSFSYNNAKEVLSNVNLSIKKGEMVGIIGPSGSGKTTITDLILRLFKFYKGDILVDGHSINDIKLIEWRTHIGYVSQDAFLINDTVENNIKFYNKNISHSDVEKAVKMANIYDFINELPDKFDTVVGERGMILSGGQKQRIILARVLVTNPEILILDEATSALDSESEFLIQKAIESFKGKVTVIVIAHRISTIMNADRLVAIENGKILEQGPPAELLKDKTSYLYKVYNLT